MGPSWGEGASDVGAIDDGGQRTVQPGMLDGVGVTIICAAHAVQPGEEDVVGKGDARCLSTGKLIDIEHLAKLVGKVVLDEHLADGDDGGEDGLDGLHNYLQDALRRCSKGNNNITGADVHLARQVR